MYSVSFLIGHAAPEDSEVVLDMVELEIGVEMFEDSVGTPDEETEGPVVTFEATPDVGVVELPLPLGAPDGGAVGTFVGNPDVGVVELGVPLGATDGDPEGMLEETPDVGIVELPVSLGATDGDPEGMLEETPDVGIVELPVPLGATDGDPEGMLEETPDVGIVELPVPLGATDEELEMIAPDRAGSFVIISGKVLEVVVGLNDPLEVLEMGLELEMTAIPVEGVEEPEEGVVVLTDPRGAIDVGLERVRLDCEDPLVPTSDEVLTVDIVGLNDPLEALEVELEMSSVAIEGAEEPEEALEAGAVVLTETIGFEEIAVPEVIGELEEPLDVGRGDVRTALLEEEGTVAVLLVDNGMVVLVGVAPPEADVVGAFTSGGSTPGVIVRTSKSVPRTVSSL